MVEAQVTQPETLKGVSKAVSKVISTVGITQQKDGLTYEQVDYRANKNLLDEALREGVQKFVYVSVFNGEAMRHIAIGAAKECLWHHRVCFHYNGNGFSNPNASRKT